MCIVCDSIVRNHFLDARTTRFVMCPIFPPFHPPAPLVIRVQERDVPGALLHLDGLGPMETWKMVLNPPASTSTSAAMGKGEETAKDMTFSAPAHA